MILQRQVQRRWLPSCRALLVACVALLLLWWARASWSTRSTVTNNNGLRAALKFSPLFMLDTDSYRSPFGGWGERSLRMRCKTYFRQTYEVHNAWENRLLLRNEDQYFKDIVASLAMERLRVYDECFISGGLAVHDSMLEPLTRIELRTRMFPFLAPSHRQDLIWPTVINATSGRHIRRLLKISTGELHRIRPDRSFWYNWREFANGRGIAVAVNDELADSFQALLAVLDHLGNTLPVQAVHNGGELSQRRFDELVAHIQAHSRQQVFFVDCTPTLRNMWLRKFARVPPSRLAALFNSFDEFVLLDASAVPFVPPAQLLALPEFADTAALFFKGRAYTTQPQRSCLHSMARLLPSAEEARLWRGAAAFNASGAAAARDGAAAALLRAGLVDGLDHALVLVRKPRALAALLAALLLDLQPRAPGCRPHARSLFPLALHAMALPYAVHPGAAGALGELDPAAPADCPVLCSAQLAHLDAAGRLLWASGGLRRCHTSDARRDFRDNDAHFRPAPASPDGLAEARARPLSVHAFLAPASPAGWTPHPDCAHTTHCAALCRQPSADVMLGTLLRFGQAERRRHADLTRIWNDALPAFLRQA
ncbi:FADR020Cp [Eremothecium gossypii FDAG1]|nr:FADR020Cp [Eremothecium gossypii FDAG1]